MASGGSSPEKTLASFLKTRFPEEAQAKPVPKLEFDLNVKGHELDGVVQCSRYAEWQNINQNPEKKILPEFEMKLSTLDETLCMVVPTELYLCTLEPVLGAKDLIPDEIKKIIVTMVKVLFFRYNRTWRQVRYGSFPPLKDLIVNSEGFILMKVLPFREQEIRAIPGVGGTVYDQLQFLKNESEKLLEAQLADFSCPTSLEAAIANFPSGRPVEHGNANGKRKNRDDQEDHSGSKRREIALEASTVISAPVPLSESSAGVNALSAISLSADFLSATENASVEQLTDQLFSPGQCPVGSPALPPSPESGNSEMSLPGAASSTDSSADEFAKEFPGLYLYDDLSLLLQTRLSSQSQSDIVPPSGVALPPLF